MDNKCGIFRNSDEEIKGRPLLSATEANGTSKIKLKAKINNVALKSAPCSGETDIWHRRFAHLGRDSLISLRNGLVNEIIEAPSGQSYTCETCLKSTQTRAPLPRDEARRAKDLLEIIHCEVTDTISREKYRYFVIFIDDKSRYTFVGLSKTKDLVFEKFKEYKCLIENHTGKRIKIFRSDNGTEYCNKVFDEYFKQEGISRQLTVPDTPEQEGVGERCNRTLLDKVRELLKEAGLGDKYWGEAMQTDVYLKNLSPTKAVFNMVPYEGWTGIKPSVEHLRVFECCAYVHVKKSQTKKLGNRSRMCIFMGYDEERKGFKLMDPSQPGKISQKGVLSLMRPFFQPNWKRLKLWERAMN